MIETETVFEGSLFDGKKIDTSVLVLTVSDCSNKHVVKRRGIVEARVNHDFEKSTVHSLKQIISNVTVYDFLKRYVEAGVKRTNSEIIEIVRRESPEYVLWLSMTYELLESTFDEIRRAGSKMIGWFFDDECRFDNYSKWWIPHLDFILTVDRLSAKKYRKLGGNGMFFLNFSNPEYFQRLCLPELYDASFVGTNIANRQEFVDALKNSGIQVETFGRGWRNNYISFDEMVNIYNQSKINLCFMQSYGNNSRPQMKCKIFDICMCGGFMLCEYIPGIEEYYEIGKEIVCFHDIADAQKKVEHYLRNENARKQIADAGFKRAARNHSSQARFFNLFHALQREKKITPPHGRIRDHKNLRLKKARAPKNIKILQSKFHLKWGKALLLEDYGRKRWKDEIVIALSYDQLNIEAWGCLFIGYSPGFLRGKMVKLLEIFLVVLGKIAGKSKLFWR
ncbi:MAG: glycosyltransferase [Candidatus Brocadiaceae bacterium]|nr:glycosyltransferase [Candidatus Brocadiaceae bacterium]